MSKRKNRPHGGLPSDKKASKITEGAMDNEAVRFIASLTTGSWMRILLTVVLTTGSVMMAYPGEMGYHLLIGCNLVTVAGTFVLEYKHFKKRSG